MGHRFRTVNPNTPAAKARRAEYDSPAYRAKRKANRALINAGQAHCWRCGRWIPPDTGHTGHPHLLPECTKCNITDGAVRGGKAANAQRRGFTRPDW
jgi:hypothetical protein